MTEEAVSFIYWPVYKQRLRPPVFSLDTHSAYKHMLIVSFQGDLNKIDAFSAADYKAQINNHWSNCRKGSVNVKWLLKIAKKAKVKLWFKKMVPNMSKGEAKTCKTQVDVCRTQLQS